MTDDEINEMVAMVSNEPSDAELRAFARAIEQRTLTNEKVRWYQEGVEAEREACAKECESARPTTRSFDSRFYDACNLCALFIRNRGNDEWREEVETAMQNIEKRWNDPPKPFFEEFDE